MILVGIGFIYLVTNFVSKLERTAPGLESSQFRKSKEYARYYRKDADGDVVLNFAGVPLDKAKSVWGNSIVKESILDYFPNFNIMRQIVLTQLDKSEFKTFLLKRFKKIEGDYLDGAIDLDQARKALEDIK